MNAIVLDGRWEFRKVGDREWLPARVPGSNFTDLMRAGRIPDPFVGDNESKVRWVCEAAWEYRRSFRVDRALLAHDRVFLEFDGLDTIAEVRLNGKRIARVDNMFVPWRFEVKRLLREGENEVRVRFGSPVSRISWKRRHPYVSWPGDMSLGGGPFVRKAPCQYGWDWGPRVPPSGIWRSVRMTGRDGGRIAEIHPRQEHSDGRVLVRVRTEVERWNRLSLAVRVSLSGPGGFRKASVSPLAPGKTSAMAEFAVNSPRLWWPNGYGKQPLYTLKVELLSGEGVVLDREARRMGLRTVELRRRPDRWGESFYFHVNGVPVFAKGANWIPADSFPERVTPEGYRRLLGSAAAAHMNMVRVWGGGFYENEVFYDLCDELGLLVWQDFMFACSVYPTGDRAFQANFRREAVENIRRLRHRPCLALWCGNNEMESGQVDWGWRNDPPNRRRYFNFFNVMLPAIVRKEAPDTAYWPSSPASGFRMRNPSDETRGDVHGWWVWHGRVPFTEYRKHTPRFMSEFGFQSLPDPETMGAAIPPSERNMTSYIMDFRQRSGVGNAIILHYIAETFRMPSAFAGMRYVTQLLQAEAMRFGIEHWRRNRARTGGTIYWQLNDCWQGPTWSSIDYAGRWKALHYFARRFYAPVLLSACDEPGRVRLHVTNDTARPFRGAVEWRIETVEGKRLAGGRRAVRANPLADTLAADLRLERVAGGADRRRAVLVHRLRDGAGREVSGGIVPLTPTKHMALEEPELSVRVRPRGRLWAVTVGAKKLARFVELRVRGTPRVWSDNWFDLAAGASRTVTVPRLLGEAAAAFRGRMGCVSLIDSYK